MRPVWICTAIAACSSSTPPEVIVGSVAQPSELGCVTLCTHAALTFKPAWTSAGPSVALTGSATCAGTPEYKFWVKPPGSAWTILHTYGPENTYIWATKGLPNGTYDFEVWVRNEGSSMSEESYEDRLFEIEPQAPCANARLTFNSLSPTTVTLTGSAACGGKPEFSFWVQAPGETWQNVQPYGASDAFTWDTTGLAAGTYDFEVWARDVGSTIDEEAYIGEHYRLN